MTAPKLPLRDVLTAGGVLAAVAIVAAVSFSAVASPPDFKARLARVDAQAARAAALYRATGSGGYGPEAICTEDAAREAEALHAVVTTFAGQNGLTIEAMEARPEPAPQVSAKLAPVRVRAVLTGPYESAVALLAVLSRERPQIFLDSLDLVPKTANVTLSFSGRAFCSA